MKRHHWPETLKKQKREASHQRTAECVPRLKKLVREIQGSMPRTGDAEVAYRKDSPRGNFSLYPILFIASQEMFVNSGCRGSHQVRAAGWISVLGTGLSATQKNPCTNLLQFRTTGANDIQSGRSALHSNRVESFHRGSRLSSHGSFDSMASADDLAAGVWLFRLLFLPLRSFRGAAATDP